MSGAPSWMVHDPPSPLNAEALESCLGIITLLVSWCVLAPVLALIGKSNRECPHGVASRRRFLLPGVVLIRYRAARAREWGVRWAGPCGVVSWVGVIAM